MLNLLARAPIGDVLRGMSSPEYQAAMYDGYVNRLARVGIVSGNDFDEQDNEVGADLVGAWLTRNVKIYREVLARTDYAGRDRLVVFIGADHVEPLRQLFQSNFNFRVAAVSEYL
ncbi:MAG TPA: DUF5694 domain-containing protein [Rubricoccaceae bacterium]|jgi:hypothetical protein